MSAHNVLRELYDAPNQILDIATGGTYKVDRNWLFIPIVTAAAETRTLPAPVKAGTVVFMSMKTDGGDCVVTVTGGYDEAGSTTLTFANVGETIGLISVITTGTTYGWRVMWNDGVAGPSTVQGTITADVIDALSLKINGTTVNATAAEINQWTDESAKNEVVVTTNVIAASESGKTFFLDLAGGFTSTLPAPALGLWFKFIVKTAPTTSYVITTTTSANILYGMMLERAGTAGVAGAARDTFNFVANQSIIGDWAEFHSDGTNWYYHGMVDVAAGNTVAAT